MNEKIKVVTGVSEADYCIFGSGKDQLIMIPGLSLTPVLHSVEAIAAAYKQFAGRYTVYLFAPRAALPLGYTVHTFSRDIHAVACRLGIERADVFGVSLGGMAAQCLTADFPHTVRSLLLASTSSRPNPFSEYRLNMWAMLAEAGNNEELNNDVFSSIYSPAFYNKYRDVFSCLISQGTAQEMRDFSILCRAARAFDMGARIHSLTCPTFVIGSWNDAVLSGDASVRIARDLRCPLFMYSGYGHAVYDEAPDYKQRMLDFFTSDTTLSS